MSVKSVVGKLIDALYGDNQDSINLELHAELDQPETVEVTEE